MGTQDTHGTADRTPAPPESDAAALRRSEIVDAARSLYEEKGMTHTSVQDITARVGVTRSLFYHYFPNKEAVTSAVLDTYVEDFLESLRLWNENRVEGQIEDALDNVVALLRLGLFENDSFRIALATHENAALYIEFVNKVADQLSDYIVSSTVKDYELLHGLPIEHPYETFYVLIVGLVSYLRRHPDAPDALLKDLIAQTLHLERA
jgi:AcrR family transcriptional regulator